MKEEQIKEILNNTATNSILRIAKKHKVELDNTETRMLFIDLYRQGAIDGLEMIRRKE